MQAKRLLIAFLGASAALGLVLWLLFRTPAVRPAEALVPALPTAAAPEERLVQGEAEEDLPATTDAPAKAGLEHEPRERVAADEERTTARRARDELAPSGVRGRVLGPRGDPLEGALVLAAPLAERWPWPLDARRSPQSRHEPPLSARTDEDGDYTIRGLPPGPLRLAFRSEAAAPLDVDDLWLPAATTASVDVRLDAGVVFEGYVTGPEGPVEGAELFALDFVPTVPGMRLNERCGSPLAATDGNGEFRARLAPGGWRVLVQHPEHPEAFFEGFATSESPGGSHAFHLERGGAIAGEVELGEPLEERAFVVRCVPLRELLRWKRSRAPLDEALEHAAGYRECALDGEGHFRLEGLEEGELHYVRLLRREQLLETEDGFAVWDVVDPGSAELAYGPGGALSGRVVDRASGRAVEDFVLRLEGATPEDELDEHGRLVREHPGGRVSWADIRPRTAGTTRTHPPRLESGPLELAVLADGFDLLEVDELKLGPGQTLDLGVLRLRPLPELRVRVVDAESEAPVPDAEVVLGQPTPVLFGRASSSARSNRSGLATLTMLPTGRALVRASAPGYGPALVWATGAQGGAAPLELRLAAPGRVVVGLLARPGEAPREIEVLRAFRGPELGGTDEQGTKISARTLVDGAGRATFEDLEPGRHGFALRLRPRLGADELGSVANLAWTDVDVIAGEEQAIELPASSLLALSGRILRGGAPLAFGELELERGPERFAEFDLPDERLERPARARTDEDGQFSIQRLLAGDYSLTIRDVALDQVTRRWIRLATSEPIAFDVFDTQAHGLVIAEGEDANPVGGAEVLLLPRRDGPGLEEELVPGASFSELAAPSAPLARARTDSLGTFSLLAFPPGFPCDLSFSASDSSAAAADVQLEAGARVDVDATLRRDGLLEVHARNRPKGDGQALAFVAYSLERPRSCGLIARFLDRYDDEDEPPLAAAGAWRVCLCAIAYGETVVQVGAWRDVTVEAGKWTKVELEWQPHLKDRR